ncbi:hypothetical protein [Aquimarina pacifica]|uniref:hypothetical protein n=1 Tax=Aquimarina pacifica TaxID=1296415 RepID=UPI00046EA68F|nr:hypothetical protein [Aquimarina pacifica]
MQLNNIIVIAVLMFGIFKLNAQPSPKKKISQINISFGDCNKNKLTFISNDSIHFFSENKKYKLNFDIINNNSKSKDTLTVISNKYNLSNNIYDFGFDQKTFFLKHNYYTSYNNKPIIKSVFKIYFSKGTKEMIILIDFTHITQNIKSKKIFIPFKKGNFKVTDPENPELMPIID